MNPRAIRHAVEGEDASDGDTTSGVTPSRDDSRTDDTLLAALRTDDMAAFEALFLRYHASLCAFASHYVASDAVAEELVQDALFTIWERRATWRFAGPEFRRYLLAMVRNAAVSHARHHLVEERSAGDIISLAARPPAADRQTGADELAAAFRHALAQLPERCREVFVLRFEQELRYQEIAELLGISPRTVEVHMARALKLLRKALAAYR